MNSPLGTCRRTRASQLPAASAAAGIVSPELHAAYLQSAAASILPALVIHAPVLRLYRDILAVIFSYCLPHPPFCPLRYRRPDFTWLAFSQVCREWRHVALTEARLWKCPFFASSRLALEMVQRAQTCPLSLELHVGDNQSFPCYAKQFFASKHILSSRLDRVKSLSVQVLPSAAVRLRELFDIPAGDAPLLETLHLDSSASPDSLLIVLPFLSTPRLTQLELHGIMVTHDSCVFDNLTCLTIDNSTCYTRTCPAKQPLSMVLQILSRISNVRELRLNRAIYRDDVGNTISELIELPHLASLSIIEAVPAISLLRHLSLPAVNDLTIKPTMPVGSDDALALYSWLRDFLAAPTRRCVQSMSIWTSPYMFITDLSYESTSHALGQTSPSISVAIPCQSLSATFKQTLMNTVSWFPIDQLRSLLIRDPQGFVDSDVWKHFASLPQLERVRVEHHWRGFPESLACSSPTVKTPYPALRALDIVLLYAAPAAEAAELLQALADRLDRRRSVGEGPQSLALHASRWTVAAEAASVLYDLANDFNMIPILTPSIRHHPSDYPVSSQNIVVSSTVRQC